MIPWQASLSSLAGRTSFSWTRSNASHSQWAPLSPRAPRRVVTGRSGERPPGRSPGG
ncbi:hypothetical protein PG5_64040 [Pseudomonas sp. G5(2012)]|nr:hypothetical protein PG5_64040 [Pseudomonas sp. G5(2012)]